MRTIAITNDDGYTEGVRILLDFAKGLGDAYAIIPDRQRSAVSVSLTLHKPMRIYEVEKDIYALSGTPADCASFCISCDEFKKPDIIFSGINWGDNAGIGPLFGSGTIGACWQAATYDTPAVAFSMYNGHDRMGWMKRENWKHPEKIKEAMGRAWKEIGPQLKEWSFFIVNMPSPEKLDGAKVVFSKDVQRRRYKVVIEKRTDPYGHPYYWLGGGERPVEEGTDYYEVTKNGNIAITRINVQGLFKK
ncbi:MAG: 5'/3'-nucleotidase SurE [Candidatus ainarchaeum sp.]|nr:5'/3'-nucleotidase SurE [Candidatus ainarchaeum sp.]